MEKYTKPTKSVVNPFINIPDTGFSADTLDQNIRQVEVIVKERATIRLSPFSAIQLLLGSANLIISQELIEVLLGFINVNPVEEIQVDRWVIKEMLKCIEARMTHCEKERDQRLTRFNPDTYIAQKLLAYDLKMWLSVQLTDLSEVLKHD